MELRLESENYKILNSGSVITFGEESDVMFFCDFKKENFSFEIKFTFKKTESKEIKLNKRIENNNRIVYELENFDNPLGTGTSTPLDIATVENKKLYMNFFITKLENSHRTINYTFYLEK